MSMQYTNSIFFSQLIGQLGIRAQFPPSITSSKHSERGIPPGFTVIICPVTENVKVSSSIVKWAVNSYR
jgi:hypothetical protein